MNYLAIKHLRESKEMTQAELADKAGLSQRNIRDLENGHNDNPKKETLKLLAAALCPGEESTFFEAIQDAPDYHYEKSLLDMACSNIPAALIAPINHLLRPDYENSVSNTIACLAGYLRGGAANPAIRNSAYNLLGAISAAFQTASLSSCSGECESFTHSLISDLRVLVSSATVPEASAKEADGIIAALRSSRLVNDKDARTLATRDAFFWIHDNWSYLYDMGLPYQIISHISIILDRAKDTPEMRRQLFFAILAHFDLVSGYNATHSI